MVELNDGGRVKVVGEAAYQDNLEAAAGGRTKTAADLDVQAFLRREPTNSYDSDAVQVIVNSTVVGYLCREDAAAYRSALLAIEKAKATATCTGHIMGGWSRPGGDEGNYGIWLDLAAPEMCLPYDD